MSTQELASQALHRLTALQRLTETTGTITNKAQRELLRSLAPDVMILVADALASTKNPILNPTQETDRAKLTR